MSISDALTGSRIRERRTISGMRQVDLARKVGISASYLNLIEHNRRSIGGKLLLDIAAILGVEPQAILEGAEAALVSDLRDAAETAGIDATEAQRAEEFAVRFPGWAAAFATAHERVAALERTVETLNDRVTHDPLLAASLHEVLSSAASIRATASILAETPEMDSAMRARFQSNVRDDSQRLSASAKTLVQFLETNSEDDAAAVPAREEVSGWFDRHGLDIPELEAGQADIPEIVENADLSSDAARYLVQGALEQLGRDARALQLKDLREALPETGPDPARLAAHFHIPVSVVLRRIAALPELEAGLVVADRAGGIVFVKQLDAFHVPRFEAACTLWPLFEAFSQPRLLLHTNLTQFGRARNVFDAYAIADPVTAQTYNRPPLYQATMLLVPSKTVVSDDVTEVGVACRVCPRETCPGRRAPSVLFDGA